MSNLRRPVKFKFIPSLVFSIARQRSIVITDVLMKPLNKNWPRAFGKRNPELKARRLRAIDWKRYENNIYGKIRYGFEVVGKII